jgi:hypothetical protein
MEDHMLKSIAMVGAAVALVASMASAQAGWNNGPELNAMVKNKLNANALIGNGLAMSSPLAGFAVESVELPDGTVASR